MNRHPSPARSPQRRIVFLVLLAVLGCGEKTNEGEVSGTVTYQGQPLPQGTVTFFDSSNKYLASSAIVKGTYAISAPLKMPIGPVKVAVTTPSSSSGGRRSRGVAKSKSGERMTVISIPAKYGSADQSGLIYTVKPGSQEHNIQLE
jgi:hypothetical protein